MNSFLVADDHAVVRKGFRSLLTASDGVNEIGEASNAAELLEQLRTKP